MYVIFPADEIILLSYGVAQNPRYKNSRPTLDRLREPIVPQPTIGTRPPPSPTTLTPNHYVRSPSIDKRDLSPSRVSFADDFMNKSRSSIVDENQFNSNSFSPSTVEGNGAKKKGSKLKSKITKISLGKLGKVSASNEQLEAGGASARVTEDHHVRIANPTFTRDNLRQNNFDAFFASGEPVYSLEKKEARASLLTPSSYTDSYTTATPTTPITPPFYASLPPHSSSSRANSIGPPSPLPPSKSNTSKSSSTNSSSSKRPKSFELFPRSPAESSVKESSKTSRRVFSWRGFSTATDKMASSSGGALKDLVHPNFNEALKTQNSVSFKLVKTVSDFTDTLAQVYEKHAEELQVVVSNFRKKNGELRKERPACQSTLFHAFETFLQEVEADSQSTSELSNLLSKQVSRPLLERSFHRKVQSRKVFTHRESFETIIAKTEEKLSKCRIDYKQSFTAHRQNPSQHTLTEYIDAHNAYVQQLHATNAMLEAYNCETMPQLLQELEEIYNDLCNIVTEAIVQGAEGISTRAIEQSKRYDGLAVQSRNISSQQDLTNFARILPVPANPLRVPKKVFAPPQPPAAVEGEESVEYNENLPPALKNELVIEREASLHIRPSLEALRREALDLDGQIRQLQDSIDALVRNQQRGLDSLLYNKANELQEDISMKKFDLRAKQIHLAAAKAQKELFLVKLDPTSPQVHGGERKMSTSSSSSMKTKWLKAFRSLKPASGPSGNEKKNGNANANPTVRTDSEHNLQEYTYKKITPCDVCSQVLRGHTRQGLRCRICKINVHADCAPQLQKCQVKAKLLRRQKSTSEIENRIEQEEEMEGPTLLSRFITNRGALELEPINDLDTIYKVLKKAGEMSAAAEKTQATTPMMDIPVVNINVPDYPDREPRGGATSKGPLKPFQAAKQGLTAPAADVSSSDRQNAGASTSAVPPIYDPTVRRRLFAGFRPLSGFGLLRMRSSQNRSISLPENLMTSRPFGMPLRLGGSDDDEPVDDPYARGTHRRK